MLDELPKKYISMIFEEKHHFVTKNIYI